MVVNIKIYVVVILCTQGVPLYIVDGKMQALEFTKVGLELFNF